MQKYFREEKGQNKQQPDDDQYKLSRQYLHGYRNKNSRKGINSLSSDGQIVVFL